MFAFNAIKLKQLSPGQTVFPLYHSLFSLFHSAENNDKKLLLACLTNINTWNVFEAEAIPPQFFAQSL